MLLLHYGVCLLSSVWLALFLSKQITRPVEALADAMDEIAAGKYDHRVALIATGEMGDLVAPSTTWRRILSQPAVGRKLIRAT
jgi:two-component system nitrogen regulation sensor histidine kinase NtrY